MHRIAVHTVLARRRGLRAEYEVAEPASGMPDKVSGEAGGDVRAATVNGEVQLSARAAKSIEIKSISGDIHLTGGGGDVDITTVSGGATIELALAVWARIAIAVHERRRPRPGADQHQERRRKALRPRHERQSRIDPVDGAAPARARDPSLCVAVRECLRRWVRDADGASTGCSLCCDPE